MSHDRLAVWCGWLMVALAVATPLLAWLGPLGFAPGLGLLGLLALPALRLERSDRGLAVLLAAALAWAAFSGLDSVYRPPSPDRNTALKLAVQLPLYWAVVCAARRSDRRMARRALVMLAWGMAAIGVVMLAEAALDGGIYRRLHVALYEPIRPDLARKNLAHGAFVVALLWPLAAVGGWRAGAPAWLAAPMAAGFLVLAWRFLSDAPVLALPVALAIGLLVYALPRWGPRLAALAAAAVWLGAPAMMLAIRARYGLPALQAATPDSWAERIGYWSAAVDLILRRPLTGWGLDASRTFAPAIQLHPHDGALQVWLELGAPGAVLAAAVWAAAWLALQRRSRDAAVAACAASAAVYLLFGLINFGIWQEWWLALAAVCAVIAALAGRVREPAAGIDLSPHID